MRAWFSPCAKYARRLPMAAASNAASRCAAAVGVAAMMSLPTPAKAAEFAANGFSFSDELGNFRILGVTGSGTRVDPFILEEELYGIEPVVVVIRRLGGARLRLPGNGWTAFHLQKRVHNRTGGVWVGFEMELQEIRNRPSIYGDGLSFGQGQREPNVTKSDRFARTDRRFEPYDRINFEAGHVDPGDAARFSVHITDLTPVATFYLLQTPRTLFASRSMGDALAGSDVRHCPVPTRCHHQAGRTLQ